MSSIRVTRRGFLRALGFGAAAAVVAPELLLPEREIIAAEPLRRYWQVGADIGPRSGYRDICAMFKERYGAFGSGPIPDGAALAEAAPFVVRNASAGGYWQSFDSKVHALMEAEQRRMELQLLHADGYRAEMTKHIQEHLRQWQSRTAHAFGVADIALLIEGRG